MRKLLILSVLVLGTSLAPSWAPRAEAVIYPPCNEICGSGTTRCSCPLGTAHEKAATTCGQWQFYC
jgi:hypothetical protein